MRENVARRSRAIFAARANRGHNEARPAHSPAVKCRYPEVRHLNPPRGKFPAARRRNVHCQSEPIRRWRFVLQLAAVIFDNLPRSAFTPAMTYASGPNFFLSGQVTSSMARASRPAPASWTKYCRRRTPLAENSTHGRSSRASRPRCKRFPRPFDPQRQPDFARENVHRAEWQHAEPRPRKTIRRVADAVEHFVHRAVTAGGHDQFKAVGHRFRRQPACVTGRRRWPSKRPGKRFHPGDGENAGPCRHALPG